MEACLVLLGGRGLDRYPGLLLLSLMLLLMLMLLLLLITIARFGGEPMILNDNEKNKIKKKCRNRILNKGKLTPAKPDRHRAGRATVRAARATGHLQILWRHEQTSNITLFNNNINNIFRATGHLQILGRHEKTSTKTKAPICLLCGRDEP